MSLCKWFNDWLRFWTSHLSFSDNSQCSFSVSSLNSLIKCSDKLLLAFLIWTVKLADQFEICALILLYTFFPATDRFELEFLEFKVSNPLITFVMQSWNVCDDMSRFSSMLLVLSCCLTSALAKLTLLFKRFISNSFFDLCILFQAPRTVAFLYIFRYDYASASLFTFCYL